MNIGSVRKRKAISPVLATVILIAITLVAGVAIAGFAFGLFGTLGTTANIKELAAVCSHQAATNSTVGVKVTNTGGATGTLNGISPSNLNSNTTISYNIPANTASIWLWFDPAVATISSGQTITGNLLISGGNPVPFSATCT